MKCVRLQQLMTSVTAAWGVKFLKAHVYLETCRNVCTREMAQKRFMFN